jgi:hypothetical protein
MQKVSVYVDTALWKRPKAISKETVPVTVIIISVLK